MPHPKATRSANPAPPTPARVGGPDRNPIRVDRLLENLTVPDGLGRDEYAVLIDAAKAERSENVRLMNLSRAMTPKRNSALTAFIHGCRLKMGAPAEQDERL